MHGLLKGLQAIVRTLFGVAVVVLICAVVVGFTLSWVWSDRHSIRLVEIRSPSTVAVDRAAATICGHVLTAANLTPGSAVAMRFRFNCESSYVVRVRLASGKVLDSGGGYVTNGLPGHDIFTIVDADTIRYEPRFLSDAELAAASRRTE